MSENPPTTDMFFGDESNPTLWFAKFQHMLPPAWSDSERVAHFANHIVPNSLASDWYDTLFPSDKTSLDGVRKAFNIRWPPVERPKLSRAEQREHIKGLVLKEDNIGKWMTQPDKREADYGQNIWAAEVVKAAIAMGDGSGILVDCAVEGIPNLLKDHLTCSYTSWDEFKRDIRNVGPHKLKRGKEVLAKERERDADLALLRAYTAATAASLQQAIGQLSRLRVSPMSYVPHTSSLYYPPPYPPAPWSYVSPLSSPFTVIPCPTLSDPTSASWPPMQSQPLTKELILEWVAAIPQRTATEEGRQQHKADVSAWHSLYGPEATPSLVRPYPITPGTAIPGSGECFNCGMVTNPRHKGADCEFANSLPPMETDWRRVVASMLRHVAQTQPAAEPVLVQSVWQSPHPNPHYNRAPMPVMEVNPPYESPRARHYSLHTEWPGVQYDYSRRYVENDQGLQRMHLL